MDITPLYELRNRLRAAMIAGTNLISEDFRLKRAVEDVKPFGKTSPVFAKIVALCESLINEGNGTDSSVSDTNVSGSDANVPDAKGSDANGPDVNGNTKSEADKNEILLDAITLLDAVLYTQGAVEVKKKIEDIRDTKESKTGIIIENIPYSTLKPLLEALTTSGSGRYSYVLEMHEQKPEIFRDYRVVTAMVGALGASYAELAENVSQWMKESGEEIIPLLTNGFDPKGKKEMLRRLSVIEHTAGEKANDFYLANLNESEKDVRQALIFALRHNQENTEILIELAKNEKGKMKKTAYAALAYMNSNEAETFFEGIYQKKPETVMEALYLSKAEWASKMAAKCLKDQLDKWKDLYDKGEKIAVDKKEEELLNDTLLALVGKNGSEICEVFKEVIELEEKFQIVSNQTKSEYKGYLHTDFRTVGYSCYGDLFQLNDIARLSADNDDLVGFKAMIAHVLKLNLIINPDENLKNLAMELQENGTYLGTVITAQLLYNENFSEWMSGKIDNGGFLKLFHGKTEKQMLKILEKELSHLEYDNETKQYILKAVILDANKNRCRFKKPVACDVKGELTELMIGLGHRVFDRVLEQCVDKDDEAYKKRLEEYFYQCALTASGVECEKYWRALKKCGCERCDGLFMRAVSTMNPLNGYQFGLMLDTLPGTSEARKTEANKVFDLICKGKIQTHKYFNYDELYKKVNNMD